jgi:hypothetical protein
LSKKTISQWTVILHNQGHLIGTSGRMYGSTYIYGSSGTTLAAIGGPKSFSNASSKIKYEITKSDVTYLNTKKSKCLIGRIYADFKRTHVGHNNVLVSRTIKKIKCSVLSTNRKQRNFNFVVMEHTLGVSCLNTVMNEHWARANFQFNLITLYLCCVLQVSKQICCHQNGVCPALDYKN